MSACIRQTAASRSNSFSLLFSYFVAQYVLIIVVWFFCENICWFPRNEFFRSTAQIWKFTWSRYFYRHNPLFYHLHLIPCQYWSWQRYIYFLVNIFVRYTFSMSKISFKTKTVLTMTDMTESTKLLAFKRQKDGYKVTVKSYLCTCVVLSWDELKVRQNLLASDYEIYIVWLLVATVYWHKSLHFVKKSNMTLLPCLFITLPHFSQI